jgi:membrane protein implicated in regulation of membrane protease activity
MSFLAWLAIAIIFLILEIGSLSLLYASFTLGAVLAGVCTLLTRSVTLQAAIFITSSALLILLSRSLQREPMVRRGGTRGT